MKIFSRPASLFTALLAGALFGVASFAQTSAPPKPKAPAPAASSSQKEPEAQSPSSPDEVVMTVGNTKVTKADIDFLIGHLSPHMRGVVAREGKSDLGHDYAIMLLLSRKAVSDHLDASPDIHWEVEFQKDQVLSHAEYEDLVKRAQISPEEISAYYSTHKDDFEEANIREFIAMKKPENAKPGSPGLSPEDARARLASIRKAIAAGTDIVEVEKKYAVPNVVLIDTKPRTIRKGELMPALDEAAFKLKDNQFSDPVEAPEAMIMLQVISHQEIPFKDISPRIENGLRIQKARQEVDNLLAGAHVWMDPGYFKAPAAPQPSGTKPAHAVPGASGSGAAPAPQKPAHP